MAESGNDNFFSTVGGGGFKRGIGSAGGEDDEGDLAPDLSALAKGPTFVKSQAKTLF